MSLMKRVAMNLSSLVEDIAKEGDTLLEAAYEKLRGLHKEVGDLTRDNASLAKQLHEAQAEHDKLKVFADAVQVEAYERQSLLQRYGDEIEKLKQEKHRLAKDLQAELNAKCGWCGKP